MSSCAGACAGVDGPDLRQVGALSDSLGFRVRALTCGVLMMGTPPRNDAFDRYTLGGFPFMNGCLKSASSTRNSLRSIPSARGSSEKISRRPTNVRGGTLGKGGKGCDCFGSLTGATFHAGLGDSGGSVAVTSNTSRGS